jgi:SH3-like domain-containing protein
MQHHRRWALLLPIVAMIMATLACGGFQVRVTPTPALAAGEEATAEPTRAFGSTAEPTVETTTAAEQPAAATDTPPAPTAAPTLQTARIIASGGLNVRETPSAKAKLVGRLNRDVVVTVLEGPTSAENFDWYRIDNGSGLIGWIASGNPDDPWLRLEGQAAAAPPAAATAPPAPRLVDRAIKAGDRVQVTTDANQVLTVRQDAGRGARAVAKVPRGTLFTIKSGPVQLDNLTWWEIESDAVKGWAAEGDGSTRWLTPVE